MDINLCVSVCGGLLFLMLMFLAADAIPQTTTVFVKFVSPPHGYSHGLQVHSRDGIAVAKEERVYPHFDHKHHLYKPVFNQKPRSMIPSFDREEHLYPQGRFYPMFRQKQPIFPSYNQHQHIGNTVKYFYPRPQKPFGEISPDFYSVLPHPEALFPEGVFLAPESELSFRRQHEQAVYDPHLLTGPGAAQYVAMLLSRGELFFHLIPHERLVLQNQQERIENNLLPHILGSIRPNHPFLLH